MTDRQILFSAPMVRALLAGTKTQTRRILKPQPNVLNGGVPMNDGRGSYSTDGGWKRYPISTRDRLWVKETWRPFSIDLSPWDIEVAYAADGERRIIKDGEFGDNDWTMPKAAERGNVSPLFMPRWASRLTLIVTDVRVERLQDISEADAVAEGIEAKRIFGVGETWTHYGNRHAPVGWLDPRQSYQSLWDSINGAGAWEANPWVAAYTFTVHRGNIDQIGGAA